MQKIFNLKINKKYYESRSRGDFLSICSEVEIDVSNLTKIEWKQLIQKTVISEELFECYYDKILQRTFYDSQELTEDFIRKYEDILDFFEISWTQKLSEEFMEEFEDRLTWNAFSHQKLSENFIRKHKNKVYWNIISEKQNLSKEFIVEFSDRIYLEKLALNKNISDEVKEFCRIFL